MSEDVAKGEGVGFDRAGMLSDEEAWGEGGGAGACVWGRGEAKCLLSRKFPLRNGTNRTGVAQF